MLYFLEAALQQQNSRCILELVQLPMLCIICGGTYEYHLCNCFVEIKSILFYQQLIDLTRFNKIAIQGTPQMAVDKEALICLSRVYSYHFKCNFPLFYVYPALTRYLSILFLNILTLLACTHSSDNLFHTLMVLCENENFLTSNLLCFFTRVKLCPLVILLSLIWKKRLESIFS